MNPNLYAGKSSIIILDYNQDQFHWDFFQNFHTNFKICFWKNMTSSFINFYKIFYQASYWWSLPSCKIWHGYHQWLHRYDLSKILTYITIATKCFHGITQKAIPSFPFPFPISPENFRKIFRSIQILESGNQWCWTSLLVRWLKLDTITIYLPVYTGRHN